MKYLPDIYKKNIFAINYDKLKKKDIKCLIFDLDNTLALIDATKVESNVKELITKLKKDFLVEAVPQAPLPMTPYFLYSCNVILLLLFCLFQLMVRR